MNPPTVAELAGQVADLWAAAGSGVRPAHVPLAQGGTPGAGGASRPPCDLTVVSAGQDVRAAWEPAARALGRLHAPPAVTGMLAQLEDWSDDIEARRWLVDVVVPPLRHARRDLARLTGTDRARPELDHATLARAPRVTLRQAAVLLDVPRRTLRSWQDRGVIESGPDGLYQLAQLYDVAVSRLAQHETAPYDGRRLEPVPEGQPGH